MSNSCKLHPVVFRRKGVSIEEVPSKLFRDIKEAVVDYDTSWKLWAFTKTAEFKKTYKELEYDELGEVTFPSLIEALGLKEVYDRQKKGDEAARDYGFTNRKFDSPREVATKINEFNSKEKKYIALAVKEDGKYTVKVVSRTPINTEEARRQSFNSKLSSEIVDFLQALGFSVEFSEDPKFNGLFDPTSTSMQDGLLSVIRIAKGELGEQALPEEFSHLIIEGLIHTPLVRRLMETINMPLVEQVLGSQYEQYYKEYNGDLNKLKKEAAGKLLAKHIKKEGTIGTPGLKERQSLLQKIWQWAKNIFSKITYNDINTLRAMADEYVSDIYNLVATGDAVPLIDKRSVLSGDKMYDLHKEFKDIEAIADMALKIQGKKGHLEALESKEGKMQKSTAVAFNKMKNEFESDNPTKSLMTFLEDTEKSLTAMQKEKNIIKKDEENLYTSGIYEINRIAKVCRKIDSTLLGYDRIISTLGTVANDDIMASFSISNEEDAKALAAKANKLISIMNDLRQFRRTSTMNILYNAARSVVKQDTVKGVGKRRNEIMSLHQIIEHAEEDINVIDRWLMSMSDANDEFLVIMDSIVKNQQYERDIEVQEKQQQIAVWDEELRKAGYSSDFMLEMGEDGVPTGRIISNYDWDAFRKERDEYIKELKEIRHLDGEALFSEIRRWEGGDKGGVPRLIKVYINPEDNERKRLGLPVSPTAIDERMPNPKAYPGKAKTLENLAPAQRTYYDRMMGLKMEMMGKIPHRGQGIYKAIYISKDLVEGILDNSTGNPLKATLDYCKRKFQRRPDDIGFGLDDAFEKELKDMLEVEKDPEKAADKVLQIIENHIDKDTVLTTTKYTFKSIIKKNKDDIDVMVNSILEQIASENFYTVDTDFADHRIKRLPIYYSRRLKDMRMLSTDFTSSMIAYTAMAINYEKMNEVVDILEVARDYSKERSILTKEGNRSVMSKFTAFGKVFRAFVESSGYGSNIAGRMDDYMDAVVYEERKLNEGTWNIGSINLDQAKTLDFIKDYTGLLGLGLNLFSTFSNIAVGKVQQWIESVGGEYFNVKDYAKAVGQYTKMMPDYLAELNSPVKKSKLSLLIQMFDPMGDYYESLRNMNTSKSAVARLLGNSTLGFIGMNAGEHLLHCQTMLAMLNHIKLTNPTTKEEISLFDALQPVTDPVTKVTHLELAKGFGYKKDLIGENGRPILDDNGKIKSEWISLDDTKTRNRYIIRQKRRIRKVNNTLNGAFSENDKGAAHRYALLRLVMQFRQWMPAHYERRFGKTHYDDDLEQWRTGYYRTLTTFTSDLIKDIRNKRLDIAKSWNILNEHEKANMKRAMTEIAMFIMLRTLVMMGGRVKDRDRSWLDKMALYQINRMYLEVGASMPFNSGFFSNIFQLLNSPIASINTFEKFSKVLQWWNIFDEIKTGRYEGWSEWERDAYLLLPYVPQVVKAVDFDDSMFSMYEKNN